MTELDSGLIPKARSAETLPPYEPHHRAKHELLRRYMDVWLPKLGFTYGQVALVDGFASAGRYSEGQRGSPLIMLDAFVGRSSSDRARFGRPPHFVFIESDKSLACHLKAEIDAYEDLYGAVVDVVYGTYEERFPGVIDHLRTAYRQPVPTFAFVDPLGYSNNPFSHIQRFKRLMLQKSEVMVYLPAAFMARFASTGQTDAALTKLYGGWTWEEAKDEPSRKRAGQRLADLFGDLLREEFEWVTSFNVEPERHNDYYLLFGSGHRDGLRAMKQAMWSVDSEAGEGYRQGRVLPGQTQLFGDAATAQPPDKSTLQALLQAEFETRLFSIEEAEGFTLCHTKYLDRPHLRSWALRPMEERGELIVESSSRRRRGDYPPGTRMRFAR